MCVYSSLIHKHSCVFEVKYNMYFGYPQNISV